MTSTPSVTGAPATSTGPATGLLLLEYITSERWVFNGRFYPFIKGAARSRGIPCRWLCFGAEFHIEKTGETAVRRYMPMTEEELRLLAETLDELRPSHVLMTHIPSPEALALLRRGDRDLVLLNMDDDSFDSGVPTINDWLLEDRKARTEEEASVELMRLALADWVWRWLGEDVPAAERENFIPDAFVPDYEVVMGNAGAREKRPHMLVMGGLACDHRHSVARNPHFEGLDLSQCTHDFGCSYCTWYRGPNSDLKRDPVEQAERQLALIMQTSGEDGRFCGILEIFDVRLFSRIEQFADMVLRIGFPPTQFCFEPRIDRLLAVRSRLERVLPGFAAAGHTICLFRMGAENLVESENELYNKWITLAQIDEAKSVLLDLSERFPTAFEFDPTWGYITCSPWTTLEMFELGVNRAMERGLEPKGVWLYTPLMLYRGAPITALARNEGGVIVEKHEDLSLLYEASVNQVAFDCFVPWRFKDPRMADAFALVVRFCAAAIRDKYPDAIFDGDTLYDELLAYPGLEGNLERPDLFALAVIQALKDDDEPHPRRAGTDEATAAADMRERLRAHRSRLLRRALAAYLTENASVTALDESASSAQAAAGDQDGVSDLAREDEQSADLWTVQLARLHWLARAVAGRMGSGDLLRVGDLHDMLRGESFAIDVKLRGSRLRLIFREAGSDPSALIQTPIFALSHARETPITPSSDLKPLRRFVDLLDRAVQHHLKTWRWG